MRLLLVDDVVERLDRLEAGIENLQPSWRVMRADDARDAAHLIAVAQCEAVVVADSRRHDRIVDLLSQARKLAPSALRIAVGDGEPAVATLVKAEVAHRVINAPLEPQRLIESIRSVRSLEAMLGSAALRERIAGIRQLPPAPTVALALIRENASGTASMHSIAQRVHADAALAAKVLQMSNSAFYSRGKPILEIERALTLLGMDTVVNLVLAVQSFINPVLQSRAILASQMAVQVARDVNQTELAPAAATASTLAYIGKLLNLRSDEINLRAANDPDHSQPELPVESVAGAYLLSLWGLPWPIIEAVAYRDNPTAASEQNFGLTTAVHTACALADGTPIDEGWLEVLNANDHVREWEARAVKLGCPVRPN
jgi:HD-like signal output (HDOD) protein